MMREFDRDEGYDKQLFRETRWGRDGEGRSAYIRVGKPYYKKS